MGSRTFSKWISRRLLFGKMEALGYGPSEPQFVAVVVKPPRLLLPTANREGGEGGERCFPEATANTVKSFFCIMDGNRFFVSAVVMGRCHKGERWRWLGVGL